VVTGKVTLWLPAGTTRLLGTVTKPGTLLVKATVAPPAGARAVSRTVPVDVEPPSRIAGLKVTEKTCATLLLAAMSWPFGVPHAVGPSNPTWPEQRYAGLQLPLLPVVTS
jgi:hypothetical protein